MSDTITAWRYWRIDHELEEQGDNLYSYRFHLRGDFEIWDGPLKRAGVHAIDPMERLYLASLVDMGVADKDSLEDRTTRHQSPLAKCLCGVNAVKRLRSTDLTERTGVPTSVSSGVPTPLFPRSLFSHSGAASVAFAQVDLGGKVDEYEEGYRAEYARIAGPIYVVNPPSSPYWQEQIERKYGQPVIVQELGEALDWIRKDEEAHGHRQAHQDPRVGAAGIAGSLYFSQAARQGYVTRIASVPPLSLGTRTGAVVADDPATRTGGRARTRLDRILSWVNDHYYIVTYWIGFAVGVLMGWALW